MRTVNRHFIRHYIEMVVVMFVGMGVLGTLAGSRPRRLRLELERAGYGCAGPDARPDGVHDDRADGRVDGVPRPQRRARTLRWPRR